MKLLDRLSLILHSQRGTSLTSRARPTRAAGTGGRQGVRQTSVAPSPHWLKRRVEGVYAHVVDEPDDAARPPPREPLQASVEVNVLAHEERLVVAAERREGVPRQKLRRALASPASLPDDAPRAR